MSVDRCETCDDEGHRSGDMWNKDICTTCVCEGRNIKCETLKCPSVQSICEEGFDAQKVSLDSECCERYICGLYSLIHI